MGGVVKIEGVYEPERRYGRVVFKQRRSRCEREISDLACNPSFRILDRKREARMVLTST